MAVGFRILLKDPNVKGIFINIFGGIVRCERIAHGVIEAAKEVKITVPLVVATLMSLPLTRESANSAILVLAVIHESLMFFSSALPNADPVMSATPITKAENR